VRKWLEVFRKNLKLGIFFFIAAAVIFEVRKCSMRPLYDEISILKAQVEFNEQRLKKKDAELEIIVAGYERKIAELNGNIDSAMTVVARLEGADEKIRAQTIELARSEALITDKDELIGNLRKQIEAWKERFSLAEQRLAEKDRIIFALSEKYEAEHKIRLEISASLESWKAQYESLKTLNAKNEKRYLSEKRKRTAEKIIFASVAGIAIYSLIK